ncbi:MAG: bifunctional (p)ppGpp synthetase/guanosine-3',5'-bis(diphosphate) 3'-pyrophosphohydrolase [Alphaproteobacteria bacterium]|nr:bifunctional (p)ppGpp synthetase/guanosine-3',5'-bis(diphosphate) 3'-pyrophosphohydrolase [Alphaproteobacteria bacterium]
MLVDGLSIKRIDKIKQYNPNTDIDKINRAFDMAYQAHRKQKRADGSPYITHPIAVADILISKNLDDFSIIAALLHDTIEDTTISAQDISKEFGDEVMRLVEGITKLSNFGFISSEAKQAENFRRLLLATSKDIRVLLIKLADRLHNMRTIQYLKVESQKRIAFETSEIYVPLAERIGLRDWKEELEDISFSIIQPRPHSSIVKRLQSLSIEQETINTIINMLHDLFKKHQLEVRISGRQKTPASIWRKLQQKKRFNKLSDIVAFRIITDNIAQCYQVLGVIHETFQMLPGGFKDYISLPKSNGYRSLHTLIALPTGQQIEVQIRNQEMHYQAKYGVAAHWQYKQQAPVDMNQEGRKYQWIRSLLDILENASTPEDFLAHTKMDLFNSHVFVFSPKGEIRDLPYGATVIDYAYHVHSDVGNHCKTARINGHLVPIKTRLRNGNQVEIITSKKQFPTIDWLKYAKTGKAHTNIRRYLRHANHEEYIIKGKQLLNTSFKQAGFVFREKQLKKCLTDFGQTSINNMLGLVGHGDIQPNDVLYALVPDARPKPQIKDNIKSYPRRNNDCAVAGIDKDIPLKFARCCRPLPNDPIIGRVHSGRGITVHHANCRDIAHLFVEGEEHHDEHIMPLKWRNNIENTYFIGRCHLNVDNKPNVLAEITSSVGKQNINITNFMSHKRNKDFCQCIIDVEIKNSEQLDNLVHSLQNLSVVHHIIRV